jgi:hypothetical protein
MPTDSRTVCAKVRMNPSAARIKTDLDVGGGRGGVSTDAEEEVGSEVLHCECVEIVVGGTGVQSI